MPTAVANYGSDNLIVSSFSYTYRGDGNIASERDHNNVTIAYTYDLLGRLVSEVGGYSRYYSYDAAGNRTQVIVDTATTISYTYDSDGRLVSEISNNGSSLLTTSYAYDSNGSLISENDGDVTSYTYDVWGNMTSAGNASYAYNAQGLRISKTVNGSTDSFVLVGGNVWADSENTYLRGLELISSSDYFYLYNIRGDVIQLLNYSGEVVKTYDYDAYGNELSRDLSDENPFRYCGEYYDVETGLIYLRARYYDPSIGRFTSVDPIKDGLNWYAYCAANPVLYADKNGLFLDVVFDLVSLGFSIYDVIKNPNDIWAWAGLVGDVIDLAIPLAGGVGELIKGARAVETVTDAIKVTDNAIDTADSLTDAIRTADKVADAADDIADTSKVATKSSEAISGGYYQDINGKWHRPNGQFASNAEVGIESVPKVASSSHGNSLSDTRTNYGYILADKDTKEILKFGETLHPKTRYSKNALDSMNAEMHIIEQGSKADIHYWQYDMNNYYYNKYHTFPPLTVHGW